MNSKNDTFAVGDIIFSGSTYEVEVKNRDMEFWPFLQIDENGLIKDAFCSCDESSEKNCIHIDLAYKKIFNTHKKPLHIRFLDSFWKVLFETLSLEYGYDAKLEKNKGIYSLKDNLIIEPCSLSMKNKLEEIIEDNKKETEETSIKFSSLSLEELSLYRKGQGSQKVLFEFSVFSDIAKECMLLYENNKDYSIRVMGDKPSGIEIEFDDIKICCFLGDRFEKIIKSLKTIKTSFFVLEYEDCIEKISFDSKSLSFKVEKKKEILQKIEEIKKEGIDFSSNWLYIKNKGFIAKKGDSFFDSNDVEKILDNNKEILQKYFDEDIVYLPTRWKYQLEFTNKDLHLFSYLIVKDDFLKSGSKVFKKWAYVENFGFFLLEKTNTIPNIIKEKDVSEFVSTNREFLEDIKGFSTHFGGFQEELIYSFKDDLLKFSSKIIVPNGIGDILEFSNWIYVKGQGFYSFITRDLPIRPNMVVEKKNIDSFISKRKKDLEQVHGFFATKNPIKKIGVDISVDDDNCIKVFPEVIKKFPCQLTFFENYIYVDNLGFLELEFLQKLPKEYRKITKIEQANESFFLTYEIDRLKPFILHLDDKLKKPKDLKFVIKNIEKNENIKLLAYYRSRYGEAEAKDIVKAFLENKKYIFTKAGFIDLKQRRFDWIKCIEENVYFEKNILKIDKLTFLKIMLYDDIIAYSDETEKKILEISSLKCDKKIDTSFLDATLWPYQKMGALWLWGLYCNNLSGILADEMGLGKTHQAMALLSSCFSYDKERKNKYLVVCPTSVIYHWEELLKKYLKDIKVLVFHGVARKEIKDFDLLLTSYGIVRLDEEYFKQHSFEIAIFDELQIAKNHLSKTHKSLKQIDAKMALGLTGTPIENRIRELKSLLDIVVPNFLPSESVFKNIFIDPIEKKNEKSKKALLRKVIKPFLLRREKKEVLLDLPEKLEEVIYFDLFEEEKKEYRKVLEESTKNIIKDLKNRQKPVNYLHVFAILSNLKRLCDHPALVKKEIQNYKKYSSGKFEVFKEILSEARESNQKVVVFSQYLGMLDIFEKYLKEKDIKFASIRGSTFNRPAEIKRFKEDPKCEVFLASLLAAGVGIDLSEASIVIHYDRWWNIAKENQATDRVHRIGQSRGVQVFKLVAKDTIEERIHAIIERKKNLIAQLIQKDDAEEIKGLSREELLEILQEISF